MNCTIFYSWQSDLPNSTNRGFIQDALERAAKILRSDESVRVEPVIDRDTQNTPGSPDISATIFRKIAEADVFVCDVSVINTGAQLPDGKAARPTPNPNVLIELGYAVRCLSWDRIMLVFNTATGRVEDLPFDLRPRTVTTYAMTRDAPKADERKLLIGKLEGALRVILPQVEAQRLVEVQAAAPITPSALEQAITAIEDGKPNTGALIRRFWNETFVSLEAHEPQWGTKASGQAQEWTWDQLGEQLIAALQNVIPQVADFARLAEAIALHNSHQGAETLAREMEKVALKYNLPRGFGGSYGAWEFDYWKFLGHELFVLINAFALREERWEMLAEVLDMQLTLNNTGSIRGESES